jgi:hypothetical protein
LPPLRLDWRPPAVPPGQQLNIRKILAHLRAVLRAIVAMIIAILMQPPSQKIAYAAA